MALTRHGGRIGRRFAPVPPVPAHEGAWRTAAEWAVDFWQRVMSDARLSPEFQPIAREALAVVQRMR